MVDLIDDVHVSLLPEIEEYCKKHGYPKKPRQILGIRTLRSGFAIIMLLSVFVVGPLSMILNDINLMMFGVGSFVWFGAVSAYLHNWTEITNYSELEEVLNLIDKCSQEKTATIEEPKYQLPCGLLNYIKYCLRIQEKALVIDIVRWNKLVKLYDNKARSDLIKRVALEDIK